MSKFRLSLKLTVALFFLASFGIAHAGPNAGVKPIVSLDKTSGVKAGDRVTLTISAAGVTGLTSYATVVIYDSLALGNPTAENRLSSAIGLPPTFSFTTVPGFNRRADVSAGVFGPGVTSSRTEDLVSFSFTAKAGFTTAQISVWQLVLSAGTTRDTIVASSSPVVLQTSQSSQAPGISLSVSSLKFDSMKVGATSQKAFTVTNTGTAALSVGAITSSSPMFTVSPASLTLAASASGTVTVTFAPTSAGSQSGTLTLSHNAGSPATMALSGTGVAASQPPPVTVTTAKSRAVVVATVTRNGSPVAGASVAFSRSVSGRVADYRWSGTTNTSGQVSVEIVADSPIVGMANASGYYVARATDITGAIVGAWSSVPINGGQQVSLSLPIGGLASVTGSSLLTSGTMGLYANYPNPFNPATQIAYELPEAGEMRLVIYNALGQEVRTLVEGRQAAGVYRVAWDGRDAIGRSVSSGLYFYRLTSGNFAETRKMMLLK